jgi:hypothetical protein
MSSFCSPAPLFSSSAGKMSSFSSSKKPVAKKSAASSSADNNQLLVQLQQQIDYYALKTMHIIRQRIASTPASMEVCVNLKSDSVTPDNILNDPVHVRTLVEKIKTMCITEKRHVAAWLDTQGMKAYEIATFAISSHPAQQSAVQQQPAQQSAVQQQPAQSAVPPVLQLHQLQQPVNPVVDDSQATTNSRSEEVPVITVVEEESS